MKRRKATISFFDYELYCAVQHTVQHTQNSNGAPQSIRPPQCPSCSPVVPPSCAARVCAEYASVELPIDLGY